MRLKTASINAPGARDEPPLGRLLLRAYGYLRPYRTLIVGVYLTVLGILVFNLAMPQFVRWIVDAGIIGQNMALLTWAVLALLGMTGVKGILTYFQGMWSETASQNVAYDLRNAIQRKLTVLSFSFHDESETGELLSRAVQDVERLRFLTGRASLRIVEGALVLAGTAVMLFWMNPSLALLVTLTMPVLVYDALFFGRRFRPLSLRLQAQLGVLTTMVEQNLRGARVVKAYAQDDAEIARFDEQNQAWLRLSLESGRLAAIHEPLLLLIANLGVVFIIWYGGLLVTQSALTMGELVAFTTYLTQLIDPIRRLGLVIPALAIAGSSAERVFEILDTVPEVRDAPDARPLPAIQGAVRFENVSFGYRSQRLPSGLPATTLNGVSFDARPGQVTALLGPTGSGKSTIISLIPRFYDPTSGAITVDGLDLRSVTLQSLRSQVGIVLQETVLFSGTVRENIAFGRPGASEEEIVAAAQAAQAHDFILEMADGYQTRVGERGMTLSGGQKQRVAIARALLMDPRILILDDATASVDSETERLIQIAFDRLMQGRTTFVIAHRLNTVRRADQILVLDKGRIVARGPHDELLATSPLYAEIFQRQLAPQGDRR